MYGITLSGALQALAGIPLGTAPLQYGVFTAGTGFTQPNGHRHLLERHAGRRDYAANCQGSCTPGALVVPDLTPSTAAVPLTAPGTEFTPRINQFDFGVARRSPSARRASRRSWTCSTRSTRTSTPAVASTQFNAATYLQPSVILQGRIIRVGVDVKW